MKSLVGFALSPRAEGEDLSDSEIAGASAFLGAFLPAMLNGRSWRSGSRVMRWGNATDCSAYRSDTWPSLGRSPKMGATDAGSLGRRRESMIIIA